MAIAQAHGDAQFFSACDKNATKLHMRHFGLLPVDVLDLIFDHAAALKLQGAFREHQYRHCRRDAWRSLRRALAPQLEPAAFDALQRNADVRREWRTEPCSWSYMLQAEPRLLDEIVGELGGRRHGGG